MSLSNGSWTFYEAVKAGDNFWAEYEIFCCFFLFPRFTPGRTLYDFYRLSFSPVPPSILYYPYYFKYLRHISRKFPLTKKTMIFGIFFAFMMIGSLETVRSDKKRQKITFIYQRIHVDAMEDR
jgi:hypothetical protein